MRYGVAGLKSTKDLEGSIKWLVESGYAACEVQFVKEFTLKEPEAKLLGEIARDNGVTLSVHAPYFAALTTKEPERLKLHFGGLHHSSKLAALMGAKVVVCHPGSRGDDPPEVITERVDENLAALGPRIIDTGIKLGLETCGRRSQFGSLGDIAHLVKQHAFTAPVVDFAHIHALSAGSLRSAEAFEALFAYIGEHFSAAHLSPLHCHFTDNVYGEAGEIKHIPYGQGTLKIGNLVEGARGHDIALTVISESKELSSHSAMLEELRAVNAPLVLPGFAKQQPEKQAGIWFPDEIPIDKQGEAHFYRRGPRELRITNINKVLFPGEGYTKRDLITYYYNVASLMLPFLEDRPIVMQRVPEGIDGERFYEKQAPKGRPDWVRTVAVPSESRKTIDYVVVDDVTTLMWLAQIASVECHAWTSKWPKLDEPDFAVIDLDPHEPISFDEVRAVGKLVSIVLDRVGLRGFPKTSGGAGLQIFIPIAAGHPYSLVRDFCAALGRVIKAAYPERVTMEPSKARRAGKVYVDANQNAWGKTLVAPYSVRPYPGAPVSMPLRWEDLDDEFFPEEFTIATAFERIERVGDPFRGALSLKQDLRGPLSQLQ